MESMKKHHVKDALNERGGFHVWWRLLRPHTLTASFIPVFVGTMIAYNDGALHITIFFAMLLASILIQAATNMFNEYYDYVRGRSEEHTSELQSRGHLVCRLLLEKKKNKLIKTSHA